jgi:hypothetical protein
MLRLAVQKTLFLRSSCSIFERVRSEEIFPGIQFGRKPLLVPDTIKNVKKLRKAGKTVPEIMRLTHLSKASVYRALTTA